MDRSLTFGRSPGCNVVLLAEDPYVSPVHCRITEADGYYIVQDLGSTNGTFVHSDHGGVVRLTMGERFILLPGYRVRIGRTFLPWTVKV